MFPEIPVGDDVQAGAGLNEAASVDKFGEHRDFVA
jgi:hypothetical protein